MTTPDGAGVPSAGTRGDAGRGADGAGEPEGSALEQPPEGDPVPAGLDAERRDGPDEGHDAGTASAPGAPPGRAATDGGTAGTEPSPAGEVTLDPEVLAAVDPTGDVEAAADGDVPTDGETTAGDETTAAGETTGSEEVGRAAAPSSAADSQPPADPRDAAEIAVDRSRVRRAPRYGRFATAGGLVGLVLGFLLAPLADYDEPGMVMDAWGFALLLAAILVPIGILVGCLLALLADRRSRRRKDS